MGRGSSTNSPRGLALNLIHLFEDDFIAPERVVLRGRRAAYVRDVHDAAVGTALRVGLVGGRVGLGTIVQTASGELEMTVVLDRAPPAPLALTLLLALPRPKVVRRALQCCAAMGVKRIALFHCWRVEKSYWHSPMLGDAALREQLLLGLEQGGDTVLPTVSQHRRFKPFVEDDVDALAAGSRALIADPGAAQPCPADVAAPVTLAIGPEGGFTAYELGLFAARGFAGISLGPRALRVEQALPALLARLAPAVPRPAHLR